MRGRGAARIGRCCTLRSRRRPPLGTGTRSVRRTIGRTPGKLREVVTLDRLPEYSVPSRHILDRPSRVRLRHALSHRRGKWQQRIQAVLYHHGCPQRRNLMTEEGLSWLAAQRLPRALANRSTVALRMIDALDAELGGCLWCRMWLRPREAQRSRAPSRLNEEIGLRTSGQSNRSTRGRVKPVGRSTYAAPA